ncbi:hypothetical protein HQ520_16675 [bacterium]|nr:hypothetical protein [bacterium]
MDPFSRLLKERDRILDQMARLGPMRKGSVSEFTIASVGKDGSRRTRGPYLKYTVKKNNKTCGKHLRNRAEADLYRRQIARFRRFQELEAQFVEVGERLGDLEVSETDAKKNSKS